MVAAQFLRLRETGMRLTAYTDCALRVLIRLALQPQRLTTIADIAKGFATLSKYRPFQS